MQLNVQQEDLNRGLSAVARAVPTRSTLPITNNILLEAEGDQLTLSATDAETIAITYRIASAITEPGAITLPSRLLSDFVATLPPQPIDISLAERSRQVSLSCARNEASIGGQAADEFPPIPPVEDGDTIQIEADALRHSINQVAFAAATDDSRPVLTGVHFALRDGSLRLAAADGFRLAVNTIEVGEDSADREAIVPARALNELARLLPEVREQISVTFNPAGTQVLFDLGHATLIAQLIQGTFPNYEQLIPSSHGTRTEVTVSEFMRETRIASIFARDGSGIVRLVATPRRWVDGAADGDGARRRGGQQRGGDRRAGGGRGGAHRLQQPLPDRGTRRPGLGPRGNRDVLTLEPGRHPPRPRRRLRPRRHADVCSMVTKSAPSIMGTSTRTSASSGDTSTRTFSA